MTTTLDHLADARAALRAIPDCAVHLRGERMPASPDRLIILDHITSTPERDYERRSKNVLIQVTVYAAASDVNAQERALLLAEEAEAALDAAGFLCGPQRPAPDSTDALYGVVTDFTR